VRARDPLPPHHDPLRPDAGAHRGAVLSAARPNKLSRLDRSGFTGGDALYEHPLTRLRYTPGVRHVAVECGAFWLIDEIALAPLDRSIRFNRRLQEFQLWELAVGGSAAVLRVYEDSGVPSSWSKAIAFTDFPEGKLTLDYESGVLCLPSER
jgi:hypothetical protein